MQFASFRAAGRDSFGVVNNSGGIVDLGSRMADRGIQSLRHTLATGRLTDAGAAAVADAADFAEADIEFLPVIPGHPRLFVLA